MLLEIDSIDQNIWNNNCPISNQYFNFLKNETIKNKNSSIATLSRFRILLPCKTDCELNDFLLFNTSTINQILDIMTLISNRSKCYDTLFNETIRLGRILQLNAIGILKFSVKIIICVLNLMFK